MWKKWTGTTEQSPSGLLTMAHSIYQHDKSLQRLYVVFAPEDALLGKTIHSCFPVSFAECPYVDGWVFDSTQISENWVVIF